MILDTKQEHLSASGTLAARLNGHKVHRSPATTSSTFYKNLEEALDVRRKSNSLYSIVPVDGTEKLIDFCSNDLLSLSTSGALSKEYLAELARHPGFDTNSGGSRMVDGNYPYLEQTEKAIANFHGYEAGVMLGSGFDANVAIWTAIPRPGDVMLYDEASHASTLDGMKQSLTKHRVEFQHNDLESFRTTLSSIFASHPLVRQGKRTVIVSVEATYSMDGDICPLREMIDIANEISRNRGNVQFVVDEAYGTGTIGPEGKGFVCELGLEKEVAVVMHSFAKGLGCHGAIVVGNATIRSIIANFARSFQFTTAPPFAHVAMIKAGYNLLTTEPGREARRNVQSLVGLFYDRMTSHPLWEEAKRRGILSIPLAERWEERPFLTHVVIVQTLQKYTYWLYFNILFAGCNVMPVSHPVVPVGQSRLKITIHGGNTQEEVEILLESIYSWVEEIFALESSGKKGQATAAAEKVYEWMRAQHLSGFGMI